jgi:hypothetical protein
MENSHSWRLHGIPGIIDKFGMNYAAGYFCVYVNQDYNSPILWRFAACPTPFFGNRCCFASRPGLEYDCL